MTAIDIGEPSEDADLTEQVAFMTHPNPLTLTTATHIHTLAALDTIAPDDPALLRQQLAGALAERDLYRQWLTHRTQQLADAHDLIHHLTHPETSA